jgi:uncharacterized protein with FMN-binding domain
MKRSLVAFVVLLGVFSLVGVAFAAPKVHHHHNGQQLLGEKVKTNGNHVMHKNGAYTASVEVKDGKVAGVHVKHAKKGEVPVKKYKTNKKMAMSRPAGIQYASFVVAQAQEYLGTVYIGFAYTDDYGNEVIYWFPYDMILDGDTGAIEYVPVI